MNRKFEFIAAKKGHCALIELHRAVGVSKSTWYRHAAATTPSSRQSSEAILRQAIDDAWKKSGGAYGSDITQIRTLRGWIYLVAFTDLYSREVVGWGWATRASARLVVRTLRAALARTHAGPGLVIHTDRGAQFVSTVFRAAVRQAGARLSMSRPGHGHCADNAVAESLWASLKKERRLLRGDPVLARSRVIRIVEQYFAWYNTQRRHSYPADVSPSAFPTLQAA